MLLKKIEFDSQLAKLSGKLKKHQDWYRNYTLSMHEMKVKMDLNSSQVMSLNEELKGTKKTLVQRKDHWEQEQYNW